jgi:serine/threonine protein kinase/Tfp pilus assembly protein PilF
MTSSESTIIPKSNEQMRLKAHFLVQSVPLQKLAQLPRYAQHAETSFDRVMAEQPICPSCGAELASDALVGLCAPCTLRIALDSTLESGVGAQKSTVESINKTEPEVSDESEARSRDGKTIVLSFPAAKEIGAKIGPYKLLEQLGEGGCGIVYLAEQEKPVRRRVALKVIKPGMDTRQVLARFEAERQALALMDSANIAKVLDAGATENGGPYFVMEWVKGVRITDYCDQARLSTNDRLKLFVQVCQAIQHAHQKGIIHRDIKPSNVLVTLQDGVAVPKVIDFGIAKATSGQPLTDKTLFTAFEQFIGTPAYMSPEQAELTGLDIDTRSDIYALGVLLYELLTGHTPFETKELLAKGIDEVRRIIREKDPPRPSTRLSTLDAVEQTTIAKRRQVEPPRLLGIIRGDLDWIVMKAIEKERNRRYDNATGLVLDIRRYLQDEPVMARPPNRAYRLQKLVRRNKVAFAAGSAVGAALLIGLALSTVLFLRERNARERADEQTALAKAVNDFLQEDLIRQADSHAQADARFEANPNLTVREALNRAAERIADRFGDRPLVESAVRASIGDALVGLGEAQRGVPHLQRALELRRAKLGQQDPFTLNSMHQLAVAYQEAGNLNAALPLFEETVRLRKSKLGSYHPDTLESMNHLGFAYKTAGKLDQAVPLLEETLSRTRASLGTNHLDTLSPMNNLALAYEAVGKVEQSLSLLIETFQLTKLKLGPDHPDTLAMMDNLAWGYRKAGHLAQALPLHEEALKQTKTRLGPDHPDTLSVMHNLAQAYREAGKLDQALALFDETLKLRIAKLGAEHPETLVSMNSLGLVCRETGNLERALVLFEDTLKLRKTSLGQDHPNTLLTMNNLALVYRDMGKFSEALQLLEQTLELTKAKLGPDHPNTLTALSNLAATHQAVGRPDLAVQLFQETLKLTRAKLGPDHPSTFSAMNNLGATELDAGNLEQALPLLAETLKLTRSTLGPDHPTTLKTMNNLAEAYRKAGQLDQALPLFEDTLKLRRTKLGREHPDTVGTLAAFGLALLSATNYVKAETLLRECLEMRQKIRPDDWTTFNVQSRLGLALLEQQRFAEAEPLLVQGYNGLKQRESSIPFPSRNSLLEACRRVAQLYGAWDKPDQFSRWKGQVAALEQEIAARKLPSAKP